MHPRRDAAIVDPLLLTTTAPSPVLSPLAHAHLLLSCYATGRPELLVASRPPRAAPTSSRLGLSPSSSSPTGYVFSLPAHCRGGRRLLQPWVMHVRSLAARRRGRLLLLPGLARARVCCCLSQLPGSACVPCLVFSDPRPVLELLCPCVLIPDAAIVCVLPVPDKPPCSVPDDRKFSVYRRPPCFHLREFSRREAVSPRVPELSIPALDVMKTDPRHHEPRRPRRPERQFPQPRRPKYDYYHDIDYLDYFNSGWNDYFDYFDDVDYFLSEPKMTASNPKIPRSNV